MTADSLKMDVLTGKGPVDRREGVELVLEQVLVLGVKVAIRQFWIAIWSLNSHSNQFTTVSSDTGSLAGDLGRPDEVLENLLVDGGKGS